MLGKLRSFSTKIPISFDKLLIKPATDFVLHFGEYTTVNVKEFELMDDQEAKSGFLESYALLLRLLADHEYDELRTLMEYNLWKKTVASLQNLKNSGCSLKLEGDISQSDVICGSSTYYAGSVLPFRNLNPPKSQFSFADRVTDSGDTVFKMMYNDADLGVSSWTVVPPIDLELLNTEPNKADEDELHYVFSALNLTPLLIQQLDLCLISSLKLVKVDASGLTSTVSDREVHLVKVETTHRPHKHLKLPTDTVEWMEQHIGDLMDTWTYVDLDNCMEGNPLFPQ